MALAFTEGRSGCELRCGYRACCKRTTLWPSPPPSRAIMPDDHRLVGATRCRYESSNGPLGAGRMFLSEATHEGLIDFDLATHRAIKRTTSCMARRMRWSMNHAVCCVTPSPRVIFVARSVRSWCSVISQIAGSHSSRPIGESSMMVPTFTENCFLHSLQRQIFRVAMNCTSAFPHPWRGQATPFGHRTATKWACARSGSAK